MSVADPAPSREPWLRIYHVEGRRILAGHLIAFLVWLFVTGIAAFLRPNPAGHGTHRQLGLPACPSVLLFDRPCPGCGLTTSFTLMVHGRWLEAIQAHPFGPILYLGLTATALFGIYGFVKKLKFDTNTRKFNWALGLFTLVFVAYGGTRFATERLNDPSSPVNWKGQQTRQAPGVPEAHASLHAAVRGHVDQSAKGLR